MQPILLTTNSSWKLKYFLRKPLRYIIQASCGKPEHVAFYIDDFVFESTGSGVITTEFKEWVKTRDKQVDIYGYKFNFDFSIDEIRRMKSYALSQIGIKYNPILAAYSAVDKILPFIRIHKSRLQFCSKFVADILTSSGRIFFIGKNFKYSPNDLISYLHKNHALQIKQIIS